MQLLLLALNLHKPVQLFTANMTSNYTALLSYSQVYNLFLVIAFVTIRSRAQNEASFSYRYRYQ